MGQRAAFALGLAMLVLLTGVAADAVARRPGLPERQPAADCVLFPAGTLGTATSADGSVTVRMVEWSDGNRGFTYHGHGISQAFVPIGRALIPWPGEASQPIAFVEFCSLLQTGPLGWLV